jgi:hypothetical protein
MRDAVFFSIINAFTEQSGIAVDFLGNKGITLDVGDLDLGHYCFRIDDIRKKEYSLFSKLIFYAK